MDCPPSLPNRCHGCLGAKTLSYAINMSALRYAETQGAQDVIFVSSDGFVLEGPRSTVIVDTGDALVTPFPEHGILHGTTQRALFEVAASEDPVPVRGR